MQRRFPVLALALAVVAVGCAPVVGIEYDDPITPPPGAAPDLGAFEVEAAAGVPTRAGRLDAVAAGDAGAVAIGTLEEAGEPEALILHSPDGAAWERVGLGPGFTLTDVAAGPAGFVAVGTRTGEGGQDRTAVVVSTDGRSWEVLPSEAHDGADAYLEWVVGGTGGYRTGGSLMGDAGGAVSWWSMDGLHWQVDETPVTWAVGAGPAWLESRDGMMRIAPGEAGKGADIPWSKLEEPPGDPTITQVGAGVVGAGAMIVTGSVGSPCGPFGSCAAEGRTWVSTDGTMWRLLPQGSPGAPPTYVEALEAGRDGEILALGYHDLNASIDGWHWESIGASAAAGSTWNDVAPLGDGYVVVGSTDSGTGGPLPLVQLIVPAP